MRLKLVLLSLLLCIPLIAMGDTLQSRLDRLNSQVGPGDTDSAIMQCRRLIRDAADQHDLKIELSAEALLGHLENYRGNPAEGARLLNDALERSAQLASEGKEIYNLEALIYSGLALNVISSDGNYYLGKEYYLRAARAALKDEDYKLMHYIIINLLRAGLLQHDTDMVDQASETYQWAKGAGDNYALYHTCCYLAQINLFKNDLAAASKYQAEARNLLDKYGLKNRATWYITQSDLEQRHGNFNRALALIDSASVQMATGFEPEHFRGVIAARRTDILIDQGRYRDARESAYSAYENCLKSGQKSNLGHILKQLSQTSELCNDTEGALKFAKMSEEFKDSTMNHDKEVMLQSLTMLYNLDKKNVEVKHIKALLDSERQRNLFLWISVILLVCLGCAFVIFFLYRERYNRRLVQLYKDSASRDLHLLIGNSRNSPESPSGKEDAPLPKDNDNELYRRLTDFITQSDDWSDACLSRDAMSERLATNRTYLSKAVKDYTGMTYAQFINHLRINKAIEILSDRGKDEYPLKALCKDLGFGSLNAFYSNFKSATGLSPAAFRKSN